MLITLAVSLSLDPHYPMPRELYPPRAPSASRHLPPEAVPLPVVVQPIGALAARRPVFAWDYAGPAADFEVVLLDEALDEVFRAPVVARRFTADDAMLAALGAGGSFHWLVEGSLHGRRFRSAPAAFVLGRDGAAAAAPR